MSGLTRNQAAGAYRRWQPPDFGAPEIEAAAPEAVPECPVEEPLAEEAAPVEMPTIKLPTAEEIEQIYESARKSGYDAGYEEATARGRLEAMQLHGLVENFDAALQQFDGQVAEQLLDVAIEIARQIVRRELRRDPGLALGVVREALQQFPQSHAMVHLNPDDAALVRDYLGDQLAHAGHRVIEDESVTKGGCRIDSSGSELDATLETRWRRVLANLGRDDELGREDSDDDPAGDR